MPTKAELILLNHYDEIDNQLTISTGIFCAWSELSSVHWVQLLVQYPNTHIFSLNQTHPYFY